MRIAGRSIASSIALLLIFGLLTAGCGDGGGGSTTTAAATGANGRTPSKGKFVSRVNGYCTRVRHQLLGPKLKGYKAQQRRALQQGQKPRSAASFFRGTVAPAIRRLIKRIRALPAPQGDEQRVKAILDAAESVVGQIEANAGSVVRINPPFVVELKSGTLNKAGALARAYGLERCGPRNRG